MAIRHHPVIDQKKGRTRGPRQDQRSALNPAGLLSAPEVNVGTHLRRLRENYGFSIRGLAEKCGLSVNTLSLIENGKTSPSVSTLQRIARALGVAITAFFETDTPKQSVVHIQARSRPCAQFSHGTLEDLGAGIAQRAVEPFVVTLEAFAGSGAHMIVHTGYEFIYCLDGRIVYTIENQTYLLEPGDSLLFESHLPHQWQNVDATPSRAILVLYPTDERDHPTLQHFSQP